MVGEETSPLHSHGSGGFPAVRVHEKKFRGVVKWSRRAYLYFQLSTMNSCQGIMIIQEGS